MADAKIDRGLHEFIKERKISGRTPRANGEKPAGRGGPRGAGRGFRRGASSNALANRSFGRRPNNGMVMKRRSAGSVFGSPIKMGSINGKWNHDMYQGRQDGGQAKLVISNLDFCVNDQDIEGLFQEFGNIESAAVHYDRSGRSLGTADVMFQRKTDAIKALKKYNGVSLDGRPMDIKLTAGISAVVAEISPRLGGFSGVRRGGVRGGGRGSARGGPGGRGGSSGGRGGFRGGRGGRGAANAGREAKPARSAADLDAELDAYNSKMLTD